MSKHFQTKQIRTAEVDEIGGLIVHLHFFQTCLAQVICIPILKNVITVVPPQRW